MKRQFPTTLAVLGLFLLGQSGPVVGQGISINGTASGGVRINKSGGGSPSFGLTSRLSADAVTETPTLRLDANASIGFSLYRNDTDTSLRAGIGARKEFKRTRLSARAGYSKSPSSFEELDFSGDTLTLINSEGTRSQTNLAFSISHDFDSRTVLDGGVTYVRTDFDPVTLDQVPSEDYGLTFGVSHDLNRSTRLFANTRFGLFSSEAVEDPESFSATGSVGLRHELNSLTVVSGSLGLSFVNTEETVGGLRQGTWNTALLLDAGVSHAYKDGTLNLGLSQELGPGSDGALQIDTALSGGMTYDINSRESLALNGRISRLTNVDGGGSETVLTLAPTYNIQIADGLDATAAYTLQNSDDGTSHRLTFDVIRLFEGQR